MLSKPNMKDIHDQNLSFWSPQPYFIAGFFFPQQLFQLGWLYRLWKLDPSKPTERVELDQMVDFVPYYAVGNLCIASEYKLLQQSTHTNLISMDGVLELQSARYLPYLCNYQQRRSIVLYITATQADEYEFNLISTHPHRVQDFCRHWRSRPPA